MNRHDTGHARDIRALDLRIVKVVEVVENCDFVTGGKNFSTRCEPMKPAPPVTKIRIARP